jgi:hypothetical protein
VSEDAVAFQLVDVVHHKRGEGGRWTQAWSDRRAGGFELLGASAVEAAWWAWAAS